MGEALMHVDEIRYTQPVLSKENGIEYIPKSLWMPIVSPKHPTYAGLQDSFDVEQFLYPRPPIDLGDSELCSRTYYENVTNVLRMPIKTMGSMVYHVPSDLKWIMPLIERVAEYETRINPNWGLQYAHITIDKSELEPLAHHRFPGWHGDGFQGTKLTPKVAIEHSYIVASAPPTEFCIQPFFLKHLDEAKHNVFMEFDGQAHSKNIYNSIPWHLYLLDPYMVHRTPRIRQACTRLFVRITFASTELQNPHNTENPLLPPTQYPDRHDIRKYLTRYPGTIPLEMYGLYKNALCSLW